MNKNTFKGDWNIIKGHVKKTWGDFTDDELTEIAGHKDVLVGKLQKKYGYARDKAEEEVSQFEKSHCNKC